MKMARLDAHMEELLRKYLKNELTSEQRKELEEAMAADSAVSERLHELKESLKEEKEAVRQLSQEEKDIRREERRVASESETERTGFGRYAMPLLALGLLLGLGALLLPNLGRKKEKAEVESGSEQELLDQRRDELEREWDESFDESFEERIKELGDDVDKRMEDAKEGVDKQLDKAKEKTEEIQKDLMEKDKGKGSAPVYDGVGQRYSQSADGKFIPDDNGDYFLGLDGKYHEIK